MEDKIFKYKVELKKCGWKGFEEWLEEHSRIKNRC